MPPGSTQRMWNQGGTAPQRKPTDGGRSKRDSSKKLEPSTKQPRKRWVRVVKWLSLLGLLGIFLAVMTVVIVFWMYGRDPKLPDGDRILKVLSEYHPKQVTTILDTNDQRIGELYKERRTYVPVEKIPPLVVDAFVAAEDNKFWQHDGIDYRGMVRALWANMRAGKTKEGASTITQQLVKTFFLTPERTFKRKVQEIILARRVERTLTKHQILNLYLNQIYFGGGRYGVEEAARYYFGKGIADVNVGEAAMLAGLPKSPEGISPRKDKNRERAKDRQSYVLNQMVVMGKITKDDAQKWRDAPIKVVKNPFPEMGRAPEWIEPVRQVLLQTNNKDELDTLGAKVRTTLDPVMQANAQRALQAGLRGVDKRHGVGRPVRTLKQEKVAAELSKLAKRLGSNGPVAREIYEAVVVEVIDADHEVVVDLGNWKASLVLGTLEDARWNHPDDAGKTKLPSERFKPGDVVQVTTVAAPKRAKTEPSELEGVDDELAEAAPIATVKHSPRRVQFAPGAEGAVVIIEIKTRKVRALVGGYTSKVAGFDRATMAKRQPGSSFKPFVYAAAIESGKFTNASKINDAQVTFEKFPNWKPKNYESGKYEGPVLLRYALSKSINTVALEVAHVVGPENIAALAQKMGITNELPHEISLALGAGEATPLDMTNAMATLAAGGVTTPPRFVDAINGKAMPAGKTEQVLRPEVAYVTANMMQSVIQSGTGHLAKALDIPIAGKTGTSNDARDVWFIGLTADYAIGVWVGFDDNRPMGKETGGTTAVPIFVETVKPMKLPKKAFPRPAKVVEVTIDKKTGLLANEAAPKGTTFSEVFVEGTAPTEVAPLADEITSDNAVTTEYED